MNKRRWPERKEKMKLESVGKSVRHAYIQKSGRAGGGGRRTQLGREYICMLVSNFVAEGVEKHTVPLSDMGPQLSL